MRTTLDLDDALLRGAKQRAAADGRTLTSLIEEALRTLLADVDSASSRADIVLPTSGGDGVHVGVDLRDWASVRDAAFEDDDAQMRSSIADAAS